MVIDEDARARQDAAILEQFRAAAHLGQFGQIARDGLAAKLVATYGARVEAVIASRLAWFKCPKHTAEDWRQRAWATLFTEIDSGKPLPQPFAQAVFARADFAAKDAVRECLKERGRRGPFLETNASAPKPDDDEDFEVRLWLWRDFVASRSPRDAKILEMWEQGYSSKEIAAELGTSAGAIDVRTSELRKKYREMAANA